MVWGMKFFLGAIIICVLCLTAPARAQTSAAHSAGHSGIDATSRFIFYSVLEGLYEDGVSSDDVQQILLKANGKGPYVHFVYACPICTTTIWAVEAYRDRPKQFYSQKARGSTFGPGLSEELHQQLYSEDVKQRLTGINTLVKTWIDRRMTSLNLPEPERTALKAELERKRQEGTKMLNGLRRSAGSGSSMGLAQGAPGYGDVEECAVCNGAVGKACKLREATGK